MPRLRPAYLVALVALVAPTSSLRPVAAQTFSLSPNLANQLSTNLEVVLVNGRVAATNRFTGRSINHSSQSGPRRESLRIDMQGVAPNIDYDLSDGKMQIQLHMDDGKSLRIRRTPQGGDVKYFEFNQPSDGNLTVVLGADPQEKKLEVETIWHLLVTEPELVSTEVEPMLRLIRPGWPLTTQAQALELALYKQVDLARKYDREAWAELVGKLRSPHYVERIEADRTLRELGKDVVPFLRALDPAELDAEQAYRIRAIVDRYGNDAADDTPESAAEWLAADPEIWYALAGRASQPQFTKIAGHLSALLGEPIELNADSSPDVRREQLAKLRAIIDRHKTHAAEK